LREPIAKQNHICCTDNPGYLSELRDPMPICHYRLL